MSGRTATVTIAHLSGPRYRIAGSPGYVVTRRLRRPESETDQPDYTDPSGDHHRYPAPRTCNGCPVVVNRVGIPRALGKARKGADSGHEEQHTGNDSATFSILCGSIDTARPIPMNVSALTITPLGVAGRAVIGWVRPAMFQSRGPTGSRPSPATPRPRRERSPTRLAERTRPRRRRAARGPSTAAHGRRATRRPTTARSANAPAALTSDQPTRRTPSRRSALSSTATRKQASASSGSSQANVSMTSAM